MKLLNILIVLICLATTGCGGCDSNQSESVNESSAPTADAPFPVAGEATDVDPDSETE
jgi:hypothetical protein